MLVLHKVAALRSDLESARRDGKSIGFVPTMGALHAGHRSLLRRARSENDIAVMSLFVNPTQFNQPEDFEKYPRDSRRDHEIAEAEGVDYLFEPSAAEIYPEGFGTIVNVPGLSNILEGASRPAHFQGVATVVAKLLNIVGPTRAYFGLKDYQQLQVIRRMTADLDIPTQIVACDTVREPDGLAMSSRNVRLTPEQRRAAIVLSRALTVAQEMIANRITDLIAIRQEMTRVVRSEPLAKLDYAVIAHPETLAEIGTVGGEGAVTLIAAAFGSVRLIDNRILHSN